MPPKKKPSGARKPAPKKKAIAKKTATRRPVAAAAPVSRHQKALNFMKKNLGQHENPAGSNTGAFVQSCQVATWLPGTRWPWCVAAWVKAWKVAGLKLPYLGAGAYAMLDWYKAHAHSWVVPIEKAKPGAAVIFNVGAGHVAMLARPYAKTKPNVVTIGGNEGDAVREITRNVSLVRGVVDPPEKIAPKARPKQAKPPVFEVVTSASGHSKVVYVSGQKAISRRLGKLLNRYGGVTIRKRKKVAH